MSLKVLLSALLIAPSAMGFINTSCNAQATGSHVDFAFEGTSFNTTSTEFKKAHPDFTVQPETNLDLGIEVLLTFTTSNASNIIVKFYKGHLCSITITYDGEKVQHIGGANVILERLIKKFGEPNLKSLSPGDYSWAIESPRGTTAVLFGTMGSMVSVGLLTRNCPSR